MSVQRPTPAQLRAIDAAENGKVSKLDGAAGWIAPSGVWPSVLDRVVAEGWIAAGPTTWLGASKLIHYRPTDAGREALESLKAASA